MSPPTQLNQETLEAHFNMTKRERDNSDENSMSGVPGTSENEYVYPCIASTAADAAEESLSNTQCHRSQGQMSSFEPGASILYSRTPSPEPSAPSSKRQRLDTSFDRLQYRPSRQVQAQADLFPEQHDDTMAISPTLYFIPSEVEGTRASEVDVGEDIHAFLTQGMLLGHRRESMGLIMSNVPPEAIMGGQPTMVMTEPEVLEAIEGLEELAGEKSAMRLQVARGRSKAMSWPKLREYIPAPHCEGDNIRRLCTWPLRGC
jgi:hypothetical protein